MQYQLDAGLTLNEAQLYAYCGFPRSLNGLSCYARTVFMNVLHEHRRHYSYWSHYERTI